jgi:AcrR family transcriptional regulator
MPTSPRPSREEQRARTRRDLLDAAARVFARHGYHATSVDMVGEAAGYTKGAVYSNFASKEELFLALLDEHVDRAVAALEEIAGEAPAARADLVGERRTTLAVFDPDWHLLETEFVLYAARNAHLRELMAGRQQRTRHRIAALLGRHLADVAPGGGALPPGTDLGDLARLLVAAGDGLTVMTLAEPDTDGGHLMTLLLRLVEHALAAEAVDGSVAVER